MLGILSCSKSNEPESILSIGLEEPEEPTDTVVTISFTRFDMQPMTRAAVADVSTKLDLWITDGEETTEVHQDKTSDTNFGTVTVTLDRTKTYTLYAVAHKANSAATLEDGIITTDKFTDTFWYTTTFSPSTSTVISCEMQRIVGCFRMETTDAIPDEVAKMSFTITGSGTAWSVNGTSANVAERTSTINISSRNSDGTAAFNVYIYAADLTSTTTVTILARSLTADGTPVDSKTFTDVPIRANHRTIYRGEFSTNESMAMTFTTEEWIDDTPVTF